jgi:Fe-S-cluster containining protein
MCCKAIVLHISPEQIKEFYEKEKDLEGISDIVFIYNFWKPISLREALSINPHLHTWVSIGEYPESSYFYKCLMFDPDTNLCKVNDNKPDVCKNYPWYRNGPRKPFKFYSLDCGFYKDIENLPNSESKKEV